VTSKPAVYPGSAAYLRSSARPVLTIGNFDGVHRGHRALLDRVVALAREGGVPACVLTFDPPPRDVLRPGNAVPRIQALPDRIARLGSVGIDEVVVEPFTLALAALAPRAFADRLREHLHPSAMVVGYDFRFGKARAGSADDLRAWLDVPVEVVGALADEGAVVSSSRIREAVRAGRVDEATALLGRPHEVVGEVVRGDARGRLLGFPTANIASRTPLLPADGIYAVRVDIGDGVLRPGAASLGVRPTFGAGLEHRVEVYLLDFDGDLYGRELRVAFVRRLRGEVAYEGADALVAQIRRDVEDTRKALAEEG